MKCDFSGYVTKPNVRCADGRVIMNNAFQHQDGCELPLVWQHLRNDPENVLGKVILEHRDDGMYGYGLFNNSHKAEVVKELLVHGDVTQMSIFANHLTQNGNKVMHGSIKEVSLVLAGANPGALIENVYISHSEDGDSEYLEDEAIIYSDSNLELEHSDEEIQNEGEIEMADTVETDKKEKTAKEVFDSMNEEQKTLLYAMVGAAISNEEDSEDENEEVNHSDRGGNEMEYNIFEKGSEVVTSNTLTHDDIDAAFKNAKKFGSLRDAISEVALEHGIENLEILFPEAKAVANTPELIMRQQDWVSKVWNKVHKTPFSRVKSTAADITKDEARAKGYIKGKKKLEEQFALLKRVTTPQTVYKLQKLDRDDIIDITDFDVVAFLKAEMRIMLIEELARDVLVPDGREVGAEDKVLEDHIRPIYTDDDVYAVHKAIDFTGLTTKTDRANEIVDSIAYAFTDYRGSGSPTCYIDSETLSLLLTSRDTMGRRIYATMAELTSALRVSEIVEVPVLSGVTRTVGTDYDRPGYDNGGTYKPLCIIVNPSDYTVGADRGGAVSMFDDFDIDFNKYAYLIETRCSGALTKPASALVIETKVTTNTVTPPGEATPTSTKSSKS